jgi:hypothetical protein
MSQRTTPTSADRAPAFRRLSATVGELPSSHCQFVRFSPGLVRRVRCKIHSNAFAAHQGQ